MIRPLIQLLTPCLFILTSKFIPAFPIVLPNHFHCSGNHESGGEWNYGGLTKDLEDIQTVADYLSTTYGYTIKLVIGHSRGSIVSFRWLSTTQDGRNVPAFVNISGRYRMTVSIPTFTLCKTTKIHILFQRVMGIEHLYKICISSNTFRPCRVTQCRFLAERLCEAGLLNLEYDCR